MSDLTNRNDDRNTPPSFEQFKLHLIRNEDARTRDGGRPIVLLMPWRDTRLDDVGLTWKREMALARANGLDRHKLFQHACVAIAREATEKEVGRAVAADLMSDIGHAHEQAVGGVDAIQHVIGECLRQAERDVHVDYVDEVEERWRQKDQQGNGHDKTEPLPEDTNPDPPLIFINLGALQHQPVPSDEWFVLRRIPYGNVTLLSGDGGTGKTTLALMLCTTAPFGGDWLGSIVDRPGPSMFVTGEETEREIHKRLARVLAHQQRDFRDIDGKVHLHCRPAEDPTLGRPDRYGVIQPTNFFKRVVEAAHDTKPSLICLEAAADLFGGNENDRGQVRQFVGMLRGRLAIGCNTTIVLLQHPSQAGIASGSGTSGTTQWNNACRSRLYFKYVSSGNGEDKETNRDLRTLEVMKSNMGPRGEIIKARWVDGYFVLEGGGSPLERAQREAQADEVFLRIARRLLDQRQHLGPNKGPTYAPAKIAEHPEASGISKPELVRAMQRLLDANKVHIVNTGSPSRERHSLRIGPKLELV